MALAARLKKQNFHTYVMLGDGDSQEGQIWEAALVAGRYGVDNLTAILDLNGLQQYGWATEAGYDDPARKPPQDDPVARWQSFGWNTIEVDGHDIPGFIDACERAKTHKGQPSILIARTVKGKGISYMENDFSWHSKPVTEQDLKQAQDELAAQEAELSA